MSYIPPTAGGGLFGQNMWEKPPVPHALDDEFEAAVLDAAWNFNGFGGPLDFTTPPNPYANVGAVHRAAIQHHRGGPGAGSWLIMQPSATANNTGIAKSLDQGGGLPANLLVWARLSFNWRGGPAISANDHKISMSLFQTGQMIGSVPLNHVTVALCDTDLDTNITARMWARDPGAGVTNVKQTAPRNDVANANAAWADLSGYVAIQKIGNVHHGWVSHSEQGWVYLGEYTNNSGQPLDSIAVWANNAASGAPGNMIVGVDFVRVVESAVFLP